MKALGYLLLALGVLVLVVGGVRSSRQRTILAMGPFTTAATHPGNVPWSPIIGVVALVGGILVITSPKRHLA